MNEFDIEIRPKKNAFDINIREIWGYRDLLRMFVKRDIITIYKQTILGPIWFIVQPILTSLTYMVVFSRIAKISTDGVPEILFYLSGITIWNYFSECFNTTAKTFTDNANIFGKVYFPRLIMPLAKISSGMIKFFIQFALFITVLVYYIVSGDIQVNPNITMFLLPVYLLLMAIFGLGSGIIFTSLTTKYRDLVFLLQFGVQLLMYATPIIYPISTIPKGTMRDVLMLNPLSPIVEGFKYSFLGSGELNYLGLIYSSCIGIIILFLGMIMFHKTERNFIDTV